MNTILGMATNLDRRDVIVFIKSAREYMHANDTKIVLWVNEDDLIKYEDDEFHDVEFIPVSGIKLSSLKYKWLEKVSRDMKSLLGYNFTKLVNSESKKIELLKRWINPAITRYLYFYEYLNANLNVKKVFISDVRDVVFQDNIFSRTLDKDIIYAAAETGTIEHNKKVSRWCKTFLSSSRSKMIMGRNVHCVGTILGYRAPVVNFLKFYASELSQRSLATWGLDTAIFLDYLYNEIDTASFVSMDNSHGNLVATTTNFIHDYPQLNSKGELFACLHMYDRNPKVLEKVRKKYQ